MNVQIQHQYYQRCYASDVISERKKFGLATYIVINNAARACCAPEALGYGIVGVNSRLISNQATLLVA